jgi:hypothetical protein
MAIWAKHIYALLCGNGGRIEKTAAMVSVSRKPTHIPRAACAAKQLVLSTAPEEAFEQL